MSSTITVELSKSDAVAIVRVAGVEKNWKANVIGTQVAVGASELFRCDGIYQLRGPPSDVEYWMSLRDLAA